VLLVPVGIAYLAEIQDTNSTVEQNKKKIKMTGFLSRVN
jgi:hypothetical protein